MILTIVIALAWATYRGYKQDVNNLNHRGQMMTDMQASLLSNFVKTKNMTQIKLLMTAITSEPYFQSAIIYDHDKTPLFSIHHTSKFKDALTFKSPIKDTKDKNASHLGELAVTISSEFLLNELEENIQNTLLATLFLLAVTFAALYFVLSHFILTPLIHISQILSQSKYDDYTVQLPVYQNKEFGNLAKIFNNRVNKLKEYYEKNQLQKRQLEMVNWSHKKARQEADLANKAKSQFLANMSHELKTPLNAIIGYSELLIEEAPSLKNTDFIPDLKKIADAGHHLLFLIKDILDFSKIESGKMDLQLEEFLIAAVIEEVKALMSPIFKKNNNTLIIKIEPTVNALYVDRVKLRQNLLNLLSNATKFTNNGFISLEIQKKEDKILFIVRDTGIGMSLNQIDKIFDIFTQADESTTKPYEGTGLGLSITKKFTELMEGRIWVESEIGKGSTFYMELPSQIEKKIGQKAPLSN